MPNLCLICLEHTDGPQCPKDGFDTVDAEDWAARSADDPAIGRMLAQKYRLTARIGAGGMGVVYAGVNIELGQWVAVKVLLTQRHAATRDLMERLRGRFRREAVLTSRLDHPNIIRTYDFGTDENDAFFLVMELVQGRALDQVLQDEGPLSAARTLHILRQITAGLVEAHQRKVIHRDLKPHNVLLLQKPGLPDFVKLLDFGVATILGDQTEMTPLTRPDGVVGSPPFMSPEQATAGDVDQRTDLYALGVIGYQLLTGRLPFNGNTPVEILIQHLQESPPPFTEAELTMVPDALAACIFRLLEKDPAARPPTAAALMTTLESMSGDVENAPSPSMTESETLLFEAESPQTNPKTSDERPRRGWIGVVLMVLVMGAVGYWIWGDPAPTPLPTAGVDRPLKQPPSLDALLLFTDRQGHYLAYPRGRGYEGPLYAGDADTLYLQRRIGGSKAGEAFSVVFWDPRFRAGAQRSLALVNGVHTLICGEQKITFHPIDPTAAAAQLTKTTFLGPRWERRATLLGTDDQGRYYYVDRGPKKEKMSHRMFIGPPGELAYFPTVALLDDQEKLVLTTEEGRLVYRRGKDEAQWSSGGEEVKIDVKDLWESAPLIYTTLGAYTEPMGTACDPFPVPKTP